jgi:hypothetical protein
MFFRPSLVQIFFKEEKKRHSQQKSFNVSAQPHSQEYSVYHDRLKCLLKPPDALACKSFKGGVDLLLKLYSFFQQTSVNQTTVLKDSQSHGYTVRSLRPRHLTPYWTSHTLQKLNARTGELKTLTGWFYRPTRPVDLQAVRRGWNISMAMQVTDRCQYVVARSRS